MAAPNWNGFKIRRRRIDTNRWDQGKVDFGNAMSLKYLHVASFCVWRRSRFTIDVALQCVHGADVWSTRGRNWPWWVVAWSFVNMMDYCCNFSCFLFANSNGCFSTDFASSRIRVNWCLTSYFRRLVRLLICIFPVHGRLTVYVRVFLTTQRKDIDCLLDFTS